MNVGDEDTILNKFSWGILILLTQNRIKFKQMYSFNLSRVYYNRKGWFNQKNQEFRQALLTLLLEYFFP